jgi:predicted O-methyltransferase YrrM
MNGREYDPAAAKNEVLRSRLEFLKKNDIPMLQVVSELDMLFEYLAGTNHTSNATFVELGCAFMASTWVFSAFVRPGGTIVVVDTVTPKPHRYRRAIVNELEKEHSVHIIEDATDRALPRVESLVSVNIDHLHIDADHKYESACRDYANYAPLVRPGGIIQFHDIRPRTGPVSWTMGVHKCWDEIKGTLDYHEFVDESFSDPKIPGNVGIGIIEVR